MSEGSMNIYLLKQEYAGRGEPEGFVVVAESEAAAQWVVIADLLTDTHEDRMLHALRGWRYPMYLMHPYGYGDTSCYEIEAQLVGVAMGATEPCVLLGSWVSE